MENLPVFPPLDGSVSVLPGFCDFHAEHNADRPWAYLVPESYSPVTTLTFKQFADATHRIAWAFRPDGTQAKGEIVAVLIHCDTILYLALLVGLVRAGYVPFPMSPRNSVPALISMLEKTSCHRIISQNAFTPLVSAVQTQLAAQSFALEQSDLPDIYQIFPELQIAAASPVAPFPKSSVPHNPDDIVLYIHSSGSTGLPKPVPQRHINTLQWCSAPVFVDTRPHNIVWGAMALPTFHTMGILTQLYGPLVNGCAVSLYAPKAPAPPTVPSPQNMLAACKASGVSAISMVPAFIEVWAQSETDLEYLTSLKLLMFAGGPLAPVIGQKLVSAGAQLFPMYGGTEYGAHVRVFDIDRAAPADAPVKTAADWEWMTFSDRVDIRWVPQGDGTFELQFLTCETHRPSVENLDDVKGYATSDLWKPHPTKAGLWQITGRKDDVIVLGSGEKVVPIPQEGHVMSSPVVAGAVMFGRGKNQCGILVEPRPEHAIDPSDTQALVTFRNQIWPTIEEANRDAPTFARIFKEMIIVTDPARPLPRAAKSTVIRKMALELYAKDIEALYTAVEESADAKGVPPPTSWEITDVEAWLANLAATIHSGAAIDPSQDMFDQGFDSLHATFLRNRIIGALRTSPSSDAQHAAPHIPQSFVFDHPTLAALAAAVSTLVRSGALPAAAHARIAPDDIARMVETYTRDLPTASVPAPAEEQQEQVVVLLTGSTGNVGCAVLAALLAHPRVRRVYTLNRAKAGASPEARQREAFAARGLPVDLLAGAGTKVVSLVGDVSEARFGLDAAVFDAMAAEVTHVLHNAWRVDFNLGLTSFAPHVAGTRALVDFCCVRPRAPVLLFTSSIAAAQGWGAARGPVPEAVLDVGEAGVAAGTGYGAGKFVAENILGKAREKGLRCTTVRIGQVCGAADSGAWGTSEWVPILVKSSVALGVLPSLPGNVSWVPMDAVASALVDLILANPGAELPALVNLVHPRPAPWDAVLADVNAALDVPLRVVPFVEWLRALDGAAAAGPDANLDRIPAIKLLDFFRGVAQAAAAGTHGEAGGAPVFSTRALQAVCPSVCALRPLDAAHARAWVRYWRSVGFLV